MKKVIIAGIIMFAIYNITNCTIYAQSNTTKTRKEPTPTGHYPSEFLELSSWGKIEYWAKHKKLTRDTVLLYKVFSLFNPAKLPEQLKRHPVRERVICGDHMVDAIKAHWPDITDRVVRKEILKYFKKPSRGEKKLSFIIPPLDSTWQTPDGRFIFHFTMTGPNSLPSRDYIDSLYGYLLIAWQHEIEVKGYRPFSTYNLPLNVYVYNNNGVNFVEYDHGTYTVRIHLWNKLDENERKVTTAHEFFHAIQRAKYDDYEAGFWMEGTAFWMEDEVWDNINSYVKFIHWFTDFPEKSLDDNMSSHTWGSLLYPTLLSERINDDVIKSIWEECRLNIGPDAIDCIQTILGGEAAFKAFFKTFVAANYIRTLPDGYEEGAGYPDVNKVQQYNAFGPPNNLHYAKSPPTEVGGMVPWEEGTFPGSGQVMALPHLASHYIKYMKPARVDTATTLYVNFEGEGASGLWGLMGVKTKGTQKIKFEITLDANNQAHDHEIMLEPDVSEGVFIPCNLDQTVGLTQYKYSLCCVPVFRAVYSPNPRNGSTARVRNLDDKDKYAAGDKVRLAVTLSDAAHIGDRYTLSADFGEVDSLFDAGRVKITVMNAESNEYGIEYQLSKKLRYSTEGLPVRLKVKDLTNSEAHRANEVIHKLRVIKLPRVIRTEPERGDLGVPIDKKVVIGFNMPMDTTTVGQGSVTFEPLLTNGFDVTWNDLTEATLVIRDTMKDLEYSTRYTVKLSDEIKDTSGVKLDGDEDGEPGGDDGIQTSNS